MLLGTPRHSIELLVRWGKHGHSLSSGPWCRSVHERGATMRRGRVQDIIQSTMVYFMLMARLVGGFADRCVIANDR